MDVFGLRDRVISDYSDYVRSFIRIKDPRIARYVEEQLGQGRHWPDPLVQLNPPFEPGDTVEELVARGVLADDWTTSGSDLWVANGTTNRNYFHVR